MIRYATVEPVKQAAPLVKQDDAPVKQSGGIRRSREAFNAYHRENMRKRRAAKAVSQ